MKNILLTCMYVILMSGCNSLQNQAQEEIASNLTYILSPVGEDEENYIEAEKICRCVSRDIVEMWSLEKVDEFKALLSAHVNLLNESLPTSQEELMQFIENGGPPKYTPKLHSMLEEIVPLVTSCEEKLGVRGVEF